MKLSELKQMIKGVRLAKIQTSGDGCSVPGQVIVFAPDTAANRKRLGDWSSSPTDFRMQRNGKAIKFSWMCEQFTVTQQ